MLIAQQDLVKEGGKHFLRSLIDGVEASRCEVFVEDWDRAVAVCKEAAMLVPIGEVVTSAILDEAEARVLEREPKALELPEPAAA